MTIIFDAETVLREFAFFRRDYPSKCGKHFTCANMKRGCYGNYSCLETSKKLS